MCVCLLSAVSCVHDCRLICEREDTQWGVCAGVAEDCGRKTRLRRGRHGAGRHHVFWRSERAERHLFMSVFKFIDTNKINGKKYIFLRVLLQISILHFIPVFVNSNKSKSQWQSTNSIVKDWGNARMHESCDWKPKFSIKFTFDQFYILTNLNLHFIT